MRQGLEERGHDYFIQFTDARPDTGGLSGATPSEAVSWGKIDPEELPVQLFVTPIARLLCCPNCVRDQPVPASLPEATV